jgi:chromosomal replication initiator protein
MSRQRPGAGTPRPLTTDTLAAAVADRVGAKRYDVWFAGRTRFTLADDGLTVGVTNLLLQDYLAKTFAAELAAVAAEAAGSPVPVRFAIDPELFRAARAAQADAAPAAEPEVTPSPRHPVTPSPARPGRRWKRLADFVAGACNRVAFASALSVVEEPGAGVNPLVLHGPVGTGKTHLLEGVYAGLRQARPDWRVVFVTAEEFTNRAVQAMRFGKLGGLRRHFRDCDALLVDDLHFLAGKKATEEEFLHTFDVLLAEGRPVVVTTDCHPRLSDDFLPELTDRLLGGGVWGLQPPDPETRLGILRARSVGVSPVVPADVLEFLARHLRGNVRELEGALHSVRHFGRVTGRRIDTALAREALGELLRHAVKVVRVEDVDRAVCIALTLPKGTLQGKGRSWAVSRPRMLAVYLSRKHTAAAYSEIARHFGGQGHSGAVAAEKKVRQWLLADEALSLGERSWRVRDLVERVERELNR